MDNRFVWAALVAALALSSPATALHPIIVNAGQNDGDMPGDAGNTMATARAMPHHNRFNGSFVPDSDEADWYSYSFTPPPGSMTVCRGFRTNPTGPVDVALYFKAPGLPMIAQDAGGPDAPEEIEDVCTSTPGTWYAGIVLVSPTADGASSDVLFRVRAGPCRGGCDSVP